MIFQDIIDLAKEFTERYDLFHDRNAVAWFIAWIEQESNFNPYAVRYEAQYRWLWPKENKPQPHTTEYYCQKSSWGLLQIMGAVARERGFESRYLPELCDPRLNCKVASEYLADLRGRSDGTWEGALAAYNGGLFKNRSAPYRNQRYVEEVEAKVNKYRKILR